MYLHSQPISHMSYARFSRNQEVCINNQKVYNTMWRILPAVGGQKDRMGEVVRAGEPIMFDHCATKQYLFSDKIDYRNDFGIEYEVSAMCAATKSKTQILANENKGTQVRENIHKGVPATNYWSIELSTDPSTDTPVEAVAEYNAD